MTDNRLMVGLVILTIAAAIGLLPSHLQVFFATEVAILGAYFWVSALIPVNGKDDDA